MVGVFVVDKEFEISVYSPVCTFCRHLDLSKERSCAAFTEIPLPIWMGENDHKQPCPGDHGIQFEQAEGIEVKYDPGQKRDKAGRWSSGGGAGKFESETLSPFSLRRMYQETEDWDENRRTYAGAIMNDARNGMEVAAIRDGGELMGVASTLTEGRPRYLAEGLPPGDYTKVNYLVTKQRGYGCSMMQGIVSQAATAGTGVYLLADKPAIGFYRALGMNEFEFGDTAWFFLSPDGVQAAKSTKALDVVDESLEPESGIFTRPTKEHNDD